MTHAETVINSHKIFTRLKNTKFGNPVAVVFKASGYHYRGVLKLDSRLAKKIVCIASMETLKNDEKFSLFYLKSSIRSLYSILKVLFCLDFLVM